MTALSIENLGKAYRIGLKDKIPDTLVGAAKSWVTAPVRNFHRLRKLNTFSASTDEEEDDIVWALRDVSFEVAEGEVLGIIGRNGAGKSTLLKILSRITEPTTGRAVIYGRVSSLLEVGTGFHPELSGRENIYMNGTILGMTKREIDSKFDEIVAFSGVERFLDTPIKRYSSGMKVRLAFSVAAHLEPEILIIDEVLAVGDAEFQKKCLSKMEGVASQGRTVLFVSHNMGAIQTLCQRAIVLRNGEMIYDQEPAEAVRSYLSDLSARDKDPFVDNPERTGDGSCRLTNAYVLDSEGERTSGITAGLPASFVFEYENHTPHSQDAFLVATVYNSTGVAVTSLHQELTKFSPFLTRERGTLKCRLPIVPLPVGEYRIATGLFVGGKIADHMPNTLVFDVDASVFYGTGVKPNPQYCTVMVGHEWSHEG